MFFSNVHAVTIEISGYSDGHGFVDVYDIPPSTWGDVFKTIFHRINEVQGSKFSSFKINGQELIPPTVVNGYGGANGTFGFSYNNIPYKFTNSFSSDPNFAHFVASVPEPSEWAMMLLGFSMVAYQVKRKSIRS